MRKMLIVSAAAVAALAMPAAALAQGALRLAPVYQCQVIRASSRYCREWSCPIQPPTRRT